MWVMQKEGNEKQNEFEGEEKTQEEKRKDRSGRRREVERTSVHDGEE